MCTLLTVCMSITVVPKIRCRVASHRISFLLFGFCSCGQREAHDEAKRQQGTVRTDLEILDVFPKQAHALHIKRETSQWRENMKHLRSTEEPHATEQGRQFVADSHHFAEPLVRSSCTRGRARTGTGTGTSSRASTSS